MMPMDTPVLDWNQLEALLKQQEEESSESSSYNSSFSSTLSFSSVETNDETTIFCDETSFGEDSESQEDESETDYVNKGPLNDGRVHFALDRNEVCSHISRACLTHDECVAAWYMDDEYLAFSNEIVALSIKISRGTVIRETTKQTVRGLEAKTIDESQSRKARRRDLLRAVLGEYEKQTWRGIYNDEKLSLASRLYSEASLNQAVAQGREDECEVRTLWKHHDDEAQNESKWTEPRISDAPPAITRRRGSFNMGTLQETKLPEQCLQRTESPKTVTLFEGKIGC